MNKRGQAALEFLMTYGWAILVVMVIIGALAYFGVLNPTMFVPERCSLGSGLSCDTFTVSPAAANIRVTNSLGRDITVTGFEAEYLDNTCVWDDTQIVRAGQHFDFNLDGCGLDANNQGRKIQFDLEFTYFPTDATDDFENTIQGSLLATVQ